MCESSALGLERQGFELSLQHFLASVACQTRLKETDTRAVSLPHLFPSPLGGINNVWPLSTYQHANIEGVPIRPAITGTMPCITSCCGWGWIHWDGALLSYELMLPFPQHSYPDFYCIGHASCWFCHPVDFVTGMCGVRKIGPIEFRVWHCRRHQWEAMGRQLCETHLQGRVKTELEHCYFPWEDRKSNEQPVHKLQNESIWQLCRVDLQDMGRYQ